MGAGIPVAAARDFSSISPSAKALLLLKAQTDLPFARQAAELLWGFESVEAAHRKMDAEPDGARKRRHFVLRAQSLDRALRDAGATRVLEIAAGLSFRGLALTAREPVFYIDSDLPEMAATKAKLAAALYPAPLAGTLRVQALDALDEQAFGAAASGIPAGPVAVVHEGLLMYLDDAEKARLAANVRGVLAARGGWWITADVYVRSPRHLFRDEATQRFLEEHRVEEKKFAGYEAAQAFFEGCGFAVVRRLPSSDDPWRVRETWVLSARR